MRAPDARKDLPHRASKHNPVAAVALGSRAHFDTRESLGGESMVHQLRMAWIVAVVLAVALLATAAAATTAGPVTRADHDDDPAGVCVYVRQVDPRHEYCVWLTLLT